MRITLPSGTPAYLTDNQYAPTGLVVVTDIWGLRPLFEEMAERLAADWAMRVCVVEPFPGLDLPMELDARVEALKAMDDRDRLRDLQEAAAATGCSRTVLIGFCMGGMYALKAASLDTFARIVPFYGMIRLPETWRSPGQREPLDLVAAGHPERVLAIIGDIDPFTPPEDVKALQATGANTVGFADCAHAFVHDPSRDSHKPDEAEAAWTVCHVWLTAD